MREEGHVFFGEAFVVPTVTDRLPERIEGAVEEILALDWRLHDIVLMPVTRLEDRPVGAKEEAR